MLKRWNSTIYDVDLMFKFLDIIIKALKKIHERFQKRRGRKPRRSLGLYVKAIVLSSAAFAIRNLWQRSSLSREYQSPL